MVLLLSALLLGMGTRPAAAAEFQLKVLSFNMNGLPLPGVDHTRYADVGRILKKEREQGTAPQIVALQEAFSEHTDELNVQAGYPYVVYGPIDPNRFGNSGLVILSEFPVLEHHAEIYSSCVSWDCASSKGVLYARVQVPGLAVPLDVYDTHMNSDPEMDPVSTVEETREARLAQVRQASDFVVRTRHDDSASIFVGDFNFRPEDQDYRLFGDLSGMMDATEFCLVSRVCCHDEGGDSRWRRSLDHHFYGIQAKVGFYVEPTALNYRFTELYDGRKLSDHAGVEIDYVIVHDGL